MAGFCGWIGPCAAREPPEVVARRMIEGLPPAGNRPQKLSCDADFALGLQARANMGHWFEDGDLAVAIHGYPYWPGPDLRAAAGRDGHARNAARLYAEKGPEILQHLHGAFSLCVVEKGAGRALLAIDRFGVEPMCYARVPNGPLVFGATTDSVRAHPAVGVSIAAQTIYEYLYFVDRVCAPDTIYREQKKLLPGQYLLCEHGEVRLESYWRMPYGADDGRSEADLQAELLEHLRGALARSTVGEDPATVGAFLSGGLDSSTVVSLLAEGSQAPVKAFTIGFKEQAYDETPFAVTAAKHVKAEHDIYYLGPEHMLEAIPKLARAYDEPFANSSVVPAYYCALRAKEAGIDVMLAGDGGDELFAGNSRYLDDRVYQYYRRVPRILQQWLLEPAIARLPFKDRINLFRRARNYVQSAAQSVPVRMTSANVYDSLDYREIFAPGVLPDIDPSRPKTFVEGIFFGTRAASDLQRMMSLDLRITLADGDLRKVGRACEQAGVRIRYPFLDEDLATFAAKVPPRLLTKGGKIRQFYKESVRPILANETIDKEKQGFGLPTFEHINHDRNLQEFFCDSLNTLKTRDLFRKTTLDNLISQVHGGQSQIYHGVAWDLSLLEIWLDSRSPAAFKGRAQGR